MAMIVIMANGNIEHILDTIRSNKNKKESQLLLPNIFLTFCALCKGPFGYDPTL